MTAIYSPALTDRLQFSWSANLPLILQTEAAECGLACLAMVAGYHGNRVSLAHLRQRFGMSLKGASLKTLMGIATEMHLAPRPVKLDLDHLSQLKVPCILHWDIKHFVVLRRVSRGMVEIHDPARGLQKLAMKEVSEHFSGVALELSPTAQFEKGDASPPLRLREMMGQVTGLKRSLGQILLLAAALEVFALITPFFMQWVIDFAIVSADHNLLTVLALGFAMLAVMAYYSVLLCTVVVGAIVIYALLRWLSYGSLRRATENQIVLQAKEQSLFLESVRGVQAIKLFSFESQRTGQWLNAMVDAMNRGIATQKLNIGIQSSNQLLNALENVLVVWLGAGLVLDNQFTVGMLTAFISYKTTFAQRVHSLIDKAVELTMLKIQGQRLADNVQTEREPDAMGLLTPQDMTLELKDVWFRYSESDPWILQGINLTIRPGESVAIVGGSGCGKTTLLKLMMGLLTPGKGEVSLGGVSLVALGASGYRPLIGAVMQEDLLLAGTLLENISLFDPKADMQRVAACAQMAAIHADIAAMPMNYNTLVGDMGSSLSGGQKQRVLLARAIYKGPQLLFLDEATSHLDAQREGLINDAIKQLPLTRIIVAHRADTIAMAQRVIALDGASGYVGTHSQTEPRLSNAAA